MTSYDYDLVIVGGSAVGRYAAARAVQTTTQAMRVALVEPETFNDLSDLHHATFLHAAHLSHQIRRSSHWGLPKEQRQLSPRFQWQETLAWAQGALESLEDQATSLELLAASGVDVIVGQGEFLRRPRWGFSVNGRMLRSRSFLLAPAAVCHIPASAGLESVPFLTLETLWQQSWQTLPDRLMPDHLVIMGSDPRGIELAQAFNRLGTQVTLISSRPLLPSEDREAVNLIQAQLEAEGVDIFTQAIVQKIQSSDCASKIQVCLEWSDRPQSHTIQADALLLATPPQVDLTHLNLESVGVEWHPYGIAVNRKLQTSNPDIYACGTALGGHADLALARHEAAVALKNVRSPQSFLSSFFPQTVRYERVPFVLKTAPELARVGLTEIQAQRHYGAEVMTLKQFTKTLPKAQIQDETTGFCKLIVRRNGEILGAHWVGTNASEGIGTIALAIEQNIKIQAIAQLSLPGFTDTEVLQAIAQQFACR